MPPQKQNEKPRWVYRFDNYKRAFVLLREAIETMEDRELTQLEKEGVIQRFEYTWELAWKVLKDYLEYEGVILDKITPAAVIKAAFTAKIIEEGELWMRALDARNKMSHTYNLAKFEEVIAAIRAEYLRLLDGLHLYLMKCALDERYQ
ncbi:MAG: nucleotidyltransferase substrate binding protein [Deltaproteobacteria bacterium]|nr:nucleotidyltransferase substrate binding protein [Deltaproteobacteria bacterium]